MEHLLCGVERVKRFVNVDLHRQQPENYDKQNVDASPLKKFLRTPVDTAWTPQQKSKDAAPVVF